MHYVRIQLRYYFRIACIRIYYAYRIALLHIKFWFMLRWLHGKERIRRILKWAYYYTMPRSWSINLGAWVEYASGFSGTGPSLLDKKPEVEPTRFGKWLVADEIYRVKVMKWRAFRQACIDVMGEDPEEW